MIWNILLLIASGLLVLWGADKLTEGASGLARRFRVSELVIGLTVVAFGTSLPEFVVSLTATLEGSSELSIGNIVGSNLFNTLVIVGVAACVMPIRVSVSTITKDVPFALLSSAALIVMALDTVLGQSAENWVSRGDGLIMLLFFAVFMAYTFSIARSGVEPEAVEVKQMGYGRITLYLLLGMALLIAGGKLFVTSASELALALGVSETVVGLTIVAGGTSLPELATSVVAARKGQSAIAIGNVLGSNIFNVFFILGFCATLSPMSISTISMLDFSLLILSMVLLWGFAASNRTVQRWEGAVLLAVYTGYVAWLIQNA